MPGAFGGGVVQLRTKRVPREFSAEVGISGGYLHGTSFQQGLDYAQGPTDWMGIDGGWRDLPKSVANASANSPLEEGDMFSDRGYSAEELEALGEAMPNRNTIARELPPATASICPSATAIHRPVAVGGLAVHVWQRLAVTSLHAVPPRRMAATSNEVTSTTSINPPTRSAGAFSPLASRPSATHPVQVLSFAVPKTWHGFTKGTTET